MIIWKGKGFIVAVVTFLVLVLTEFSVEALLKDERYYQTHGWPKLVGFFIAGCIVLPMGKYLNRKEGKVMIEEETGRKIVLKAKHSLYFISVEYWGYILFAFGVIYFFVSTD